MNLSQIYHFILIFCLSFSLQAKFEYKDASIKTIVEKGATLAQTYLANDRKSLKGLTLLKVVRAHNPYHPTVGLIDNALEFEKTIDTPKYLTSSRSFAKYLLITAKKLKASGGPEEQMFLYYYVSSLLDSSLKESQKELVALKSAGMDPAKELNFLLESLPEDMVTEVEDEVQTETKVVSEAIPAKPEEKPVSKKEKDPYAKYNVAEVEELKLVLGEYFFESFRYNRVTVLDAINQLVQRLFNYRVRLTFKSNRISVMEERKDLNGLTYYYGPLLPRYDGYDFEFSNAEFRDVIAHVCVKNDFDYFVRDGEVQMRDMKFHQIDRMPQDGWDIEQLYPKFKEKYVEHKGKFEGKYVKFEAYATSVKLKDNKTKFASIILNGGGGVIYLQEGRYDEDRLINLRRAVSQLKKDKELELPPSTRTNIESEDEKTKGKYKWSNQIKLTFYARLKRFDNIGKGFELDKIKFLFWDSRQQIITIRHPNEKDKEEAIERSRL